MKNLILILFFLAKLTSFSQETLISEPYKSGFCGSFFVNISDLDGTAITFLGGNVFYLVNDFTVGLTGSFLVNKLISKQPEWPYPILHFPYYSTETSYNVGYIGLDLGFYLKRMNLLHFYCSLLTGAGSITRINNSLFSDKDNSEFFLVVKPNFEIMLNISKMLKIGLGINYRYFSDFNMHEYTNKDFNNLSLVFSIKYGNF